MYFGFDGFLDEDAAQKNKQSTASDIINDPGYKNTRKEIDNNNKKNVIIISDGGSSISSGGSSSSSSGGSSSSGSGGSSSSGSGGSSSSGSGGSSSKTVPTVKSAHHNVKFNQLVSALNEDETE